MSNLKTSIEWCDATWNVVTGCSKVSPGCKNCYAETVAKRFWGSRKFTDVRCHPERLEQPLHWRKPRRVFVNSMSDLFHEDVPDDFIVATFGAMFLAPEHTYQILTKRPERMRTLLQGGRKWRNAPRQNIWLGVSVENQETADERIPILLDIPATVRFLSVEPLLGPVDLSKTVQPPGWKATAAMLSRINWVIVGGESGPGARPCNLEWIRSVVRQCKAANVAVFVKQLGANCIGHSWLPDANILTHHKKGGDPAEWPADLRVREYPV